MSYKYVTNPGLQSKTNFHKHFNRSERTWQDPLKSVFLHDMLISRMWALWITLWQSWRFLTISFTFHIPLLVSRFGVYSNDFIFLQAADIGTAPEECFWAMNSVRRSLVSLRHRLLRTSGKMKLGKQLSTTKVRSWIHKRKMLMFYNPYEIISILYNLQ